jgi:hypothetical protein
MQHFEKLTLGSAQYKSSLWLRYVDDLFLVWSHDSEQLQNFLSHLNNLRRSIQFTMETGSDSAIAFLHILISSEGTTLATKVYGKLTHTGWYLNFKSNHQPPVKRLDSVSSQQIFHHMARTTRSG